jgi:hypothetical protein
MENEKVSYTFTTLFPLILPEDFRIDLRILKVREKMPEDGKRAYRLNKWAGDLWRNLLKAPVKPYRVNSNPSLLIPESCAQQCDRISFRDVPNIEYHLDLIDEKISVDLSEDSLEKRSLVESLLQMSVTDRIRQMKNSYWRWQWSLFYRSIPINHDVGARVVDAYRGFKFSIVWCDEIGLCLGADVRTKYIGRRCLSDYYKKSAVNEIKEHINTRPRLPFEKRPLLVRDNGPVKFSCAFAGDTDVNASEAIFFDKTRGRDISIPTYYKEIYKIDIPADDKVVFVRDGEHRDSIRVPACRLFPAFNTEQIKDMHRHKPREITPPSAQLPPDERMKLIREFIQEIDHIQHNGRSIKLEVAPYKRSKNVVMPPNLQFGNNFIMRYGEHISVKEAKNLSHEEMILKWSKAKMISLYKHGVYSSYGLPQIVLLMPLPWPREIRDRIKKSLSNEISKILRHKFRIEQIKLYNDTTNGGDLISNVAEPKIDRTLFLIGLHNRIRARVHDQIKQEATANVITQCFSQGTAYKIAEGDISYQRNLALAILIDCGAKPWILNSSLSYDTYIGIDILNNKAAFHFFWGKCGENIMFIPGRSSSQARRQEAIKRPLMLQHLSEGFQKICQDVKEPIKSVAIHRDGTWWPQEQLGLDCALKQGKREGLLSQKCRVAVLEVRKTHIPIRLLSKRDERYVNPVPGTRFFINNNNILLVCASKPFAWDSSNGRTAGTILLRLAYAEGDTNIEELSRDAYFLTQLNWSAPNIEINVPVTIRWADDKLREYLLQASELEEDSFEEDDEGESYDEE